MNAIILLPGARWCLEVMGERSESCHYDERIIFKGYIAQTDYYGEAGCWEMGRPAVVSERDESLYPGLTKEQQKQSQTNKRA